MFQYSLTGKDGSGSGFGSWKTVPAVPVPHSVSGITVPTDAKWGFVTSKSLLSLGGEWPCAREHACDYKKEKRRISTAMARLQRLQHLDSHVAIKAAVVSSTCLSLIDFLNPMKIADVRPLRSAVKRALGQLHTSPEILFAILQKATLDPMHRAILTLLRLWTLALATQQGRDLINALPDQRQVGRLGCLRHHVLSMGGSINDCELVLGESTVNLRRHWSAVREDALEALKLFAFRTVARRRPEVFDTFDVPNWKAHRKFLKTLDAHAASILVRIWSAVPLTGERKSRLLGQGSAMCPCGNAEQDLIHIMWDCPIYAAERPLQYAWWKEEPPPGSQAIMLMRGKGNAYLAAWKAVCKWAVRTLSSKHLGRRGLLDQEGEVVDVEGEDTSVATLPLVRDVRGHTIYMHECGYAYCARCHIARRARDAHFIHVAECKRAHMVCICIGSYLTKRQHVVRLEMAEWKVSGHRPRYTCMRCGKQQWATADYQVRM